MLPKASSLRASLAVLSGAFLVWGILRSLDDILVALFNVSSALPYAIATLVHLSFFSAYLLFSIPAGIYVHRHGYRKAILMALLSMAAGSAVCVAGVTVPSFPLCLAGIFILAIGVAALQAAGNPCIGLLGQRERPQRGFSWCRRLVPSAASSVPWPGACSLARGAGGTPPPP
jgi:FHS family L-fucose permease-like MFS transporter